jgi:Nuclease-related domain
MPLTGVRVRWWEGVLLCLPGSLSVVFLLGGQIAAGLVLAALVVVLVVSRAQIIERNVAGGYARTRALLLLSRWAALLAIYGVVLWLFFVMHDEHWTRDRHGRVAFWALVGLAFFLAREAYRVGEVAGDWWLGSETEREVAQLLDPLRAEGWLVTHDIKKDGGGNVDHFVSNPSGAFAIETKSGRHRAADRGQAISNAAWAKQKFGQRWVTAILCVGTDPPAVPEQHGYAWVLGKSDLVEFLQAGTESAASRGRAAVSRRS